MKKRILSLALALVMTFSFVQTIIFASEVDNFLSGSGTEADPYVVSTKAHLDNVRNYPDAHFIMINDVDLDGKNFVPIGADDSSAFTGTFDGGGFTVKNLHIEITSAQNIVHAGLFGYNKGTIKNLGVENGKVSVFSKSDVIVGGIAGVNQNGTVQNCHYSGKISANCIADSNIAIALAGGIAGKNSSGERGNAKIENCYSEGEVTANSSTTNMNSLSYAGGIAGYCYFSTIKDCYNSAAVLARSSVKTLAGGITGNNYCSTIEKSYNMGKVSSSAIHLSATNIAEAQAGGIAGYSWQGTVSYCYNTGEVSADATDPHRNSESYAGGIIGYNHYKSVISNCYNAGTISAYLSDDVNAGGIVGCKDQGSILDCYNVGEVTAHSDDDTFPVANGIMGCSTNTVADKEYYGEILNCYYINNIPRGTDYQHTATKCTSEQMQKSETFVNFDFENVWTMEADTLYPYPTLKGLPMYDFIDVPVNSWYKQYVDYAVENDMFSGIGKGKFAPNVNITRSEFVQVFANITGVDLSAYKSKESFSDVKASDWYSGAVNWAYENGIVSGVGDGEFKPDSIITREQMCVMIVNYAEFKNIDLGTISNRLFSDHEKISGWAENAVYKCYGSGLVSGIGDGKFDPSSSASRAQGATIFTNFHKLYLK